MLSRHDDVGGRFGSALHVAVHEAAATEAAVLGILEEDNVTGVDARIVPSPHLDHLNPGRRWSSVTFDRDMVGMIVMMMLVITSRIASAFPVRGGPWS